MAQCFEHLSLGGLRIFITDMSAEPAVAAGAPHPHPGLDHIAFEVEGLDEVCAALGAKGAGLTRQPESIRAGVRRWTGRMGLELIWWSGGEGEGRSLSCQGPPSR